MSSAISIRGQGPRTYNWPSREQWARARQLPYWDNETGCPFADKYSHRLSDYATAEEIAALIEALKELYRKLGRDLKTERLRAAKQQSGESDRAHFQRFQATPEAERAAFFEATEARRGRSDINGALKEIRDDKIPGRWRNREKAVEELVAPFVARYAAAHNAAHEVWKQERLQTPVDDAAWEEELCRRADLEARREANRRALES